MIVRIVFVDGEIGSCDKGKIDRDTIYIDARHGYSHNMKIVDKALKVAAQRPVVIYTNSLAVWNDYRFKNMCEDLYPWCILDKKTGEFYHIQALTTRELRIIHNLEKLYMAGAFEIPHKV